MVAVPQKREIAREILGNRLKWAAISQPLLPILSDSTVLFATIWKNG
jgi:hypothetical protein